MTNSIEVDVIDSLFFAIRMNERLNILGNEDPRLFRITRKAWIRHWRRVQKARDAGNTVLSVPDSYITDGRFDASLVP